MELISRNITQIVKGNRGMKGEMGDRGFVRSLQFFLNKNCVIDG